MTKIEKLRQEYRKRTGSTFNMKWEWYAEFLEKELLKARGENLPSAPEPKLGAMACKGTEFWRHAESMAVLEAFNIDTTCFVGPGYGQDDYEEGQEFYIPYAAYGRNAKQDGRSAFEDVKTIMAARRQYVSHKHKIIAKTDAVVMSENVITGEVAVWRTDNDDGAFYYFIMGNPVDNKS